MKVKDMIELLQEEISFLEWLEAHSTEKKVEGEGSISTAVFEPDPVENAIRENVESEFGGHADPDDGPLDVGEEEPQRSDPPKRGGP